MNELVRRDHQTTRTFHSAAALLAVLVGSGACSSGSHADPASELEQAATGTITISGRVAYNGYPLLGGGLIPGATVTLSGARTAVQVTDASGNFAFSGLPSGTYSVRPTLAGVSFAPDVVNLSNQTKDIVERFYATPLPGGWAPSRVFGQVDLTQTGTNMVVPNRVFHPTGVVADRMAAPTPSRLWVFDAGNNRILGFRNVGTCVGGSTPGAACTEHSGCGTGGSCAGNLNRNADLVLGQPSTSDRSACNGDNTKRAPAARSTLCLTPYPLAVSPGEGPEGGQMATDAAHNLYVADPYNNRVLRFDDPFTKDNLPDKVWGQADYTSRECNRGFGAPGADRLCTGNLDELGGVGGFAVGVDVTPDGSTLWVADNANHRVLRIPTNGTSANLVLGQPDMQSTQGCDGTLGTLCSPKAVRYDPTTKRLYVADGNADGTRVLVWQNPSTNGQLPSSVLTPPPGSRFNSVRGITLDPTTPGAIWLADTDNNRLLQYVNGAPTKVLGQPNFTSTSCYYNYFSTDGTLDGLACSPHGSIGIDRDGTVYVGDLDDHQRVDRFRGPQPAPNPAGIGHAPDAYLLNEGNLVVNHWGVPNRIGPAGFNGPSEVLLTPLGMIVADRFRLLFWRNYAASGLTGGPADGVLGQKDFWSEDRYYTTHGDLFTSVAFDSTRNLLYALEKQFITVWSTQNGLVSGAAPAFEIASPLALRGGGTIDFRANGIAVDSATDTAWLADTEHQRLLRILNVSQPGRQVDTVLGQPDLATTGCNRGAGRDAPVRDGFCTPNQVTFDRLGNLYVVDSSWEGSGRALEFDRSSLPPIPSPQVFWATGGGPMPDRVYSKANFTTYDNADCDPDRVNKPCTPRSLAFEPGTNRMIMTVDGYDNPLESRAFLYNNPVPAGVTAPVASGRIPLPFNQAGASSWDSSRRLAIMDTTWSRVVLIAAPPM
jgi:hypothetical protein